ncbi:hypothetical protein CYFUS_004847 [Cystobacter fuscus]|uniref:Uncharacterized protein n=1 Tax=Cystobacter fuscus TaxID=43 RepID=A0A250J709_9BACT|nr:hypothetical protein [Cystobacter fuscus]ATB39403.1 hypothetical protein CYFUS_004847 [Cystobacter fuscus]
MADNKGPADKRTDNPQADGAVGEVEREARHQDGVLRRDVSDRDVGEERLKDKGLGGRGADDLSIGERREAPPVSDWG